MTDMAAAPEGEPPAASVELHKLPSLDTRGKHRFLAELNGMEQEARFLEEELEQLEKTEKVSSTCQELLLSVKARPDPLLPETIGPANVLWDRWFEGSQESRCSSCWIL